MAKRSKWTSKGWWKYQARRPKAAATKAVVSLASRAKALWLQYFPTKLSDDQLFAKLTKDVVEIKNHITTAFKYRKIFRDTTEMLQKHPTLSTSPDAGYWYDWLRTLYAHYIVMSDQEQRDAVYAAVGKALQQAQHYEEAFKYFSRVGISSFGTSDFLRR